MPVSKTLFVPEIILRLISIVLSSAAIWIFVYFTDHFLVNVKKNEIEENNERVQNILIKAGKLADDLRDASGSISGIFQNESASTQELSATSETVIG